MIRGLTAFLACGSAMAFITPAPLGQRTMVRSRASGSMNMKVGSGEVENKIYIHLSHAVEGMTIYFDLLLVVRQ